MKKVLIVDDAAFMRKTLSLMLSEKDYEIVGEATNGKMALQKIRALKPEIVFLDITMPEMGGLECLAQIMKTDNKPIVVIVSAMAQKENVIKAVSMGAKDFIVKPFSKEAIENALKKIDLH